MNDTELDNDRDGLDFGECMVCEGPLLQQGGYAETGMCGPCVTGEADTIGEVTD